MSDDQCTTLQDVRTCLTRGQSIGVALDAESGLISLLSIFTLVVFVIRPPEEQRRLVQEPADLLMLSLFAADLLQATGAAMNIRWANTGFVQIGTYCTAQGAIQQLGETSVAMSTLAIALQTFIAVCFRKFVHSMRPAIAVVAFIWLFVILFVAIAAGVNGGSTYYVPTPFWCWIDTRFSTEQILGEYFWLWLTLFVSILVYVPLFLWGNGYMTVDKTHWWKIKLRIRPKALSEEENARDRPPSLSLTILGYPFVYSIIILPLTVTRWMSFSRSGMNSVPSAATFAVICIFGLSGALNVLLLLLTRPNLLLFDSEPDPYPTSSRARNEGLVDVELGPDSPASARQNGRGRTRRRRRLHDKGRMTTPSRSSSRDTHAYRPSQDDASDLYAAYGAYPKSDPRALGSTTEYEGDGEHDIGSMSLGSGMLMVDHEQSGAFRISDETGAHTKAAYSLDAPDFAGGALSHRDVELPRRGAPDSLLPAFEVRQAHEREIITTSSTQPLSEQFLSENELSAVWRTTERSDHEP
ncbi:hypothetical protein DFH11DRAFT_436935 [Phellopilus nigrolimitatus]|nr:hypothetical protein DFH11DRAFT_436935 [Phellopilus nigrolimitatus]